MPVEMQIESGGLIVRNTPAARLYALLDSSAEDVQPLAGDLSDVLKCVEPKKLKDVTALVERLETTKKRAREQFLGPAWTTLVVECTAAEVRGLLAAAGAKM